MTQGKTEESEVTREGLINQLLERSGLGWDESLSQAEKVQLNLERQMKVSRAGWDKIPVELLKDLLRGSGPRAKRIKGD